MWWWWWCGAGGELAPLAAPPLLLDMDGITGWKADPDGEVEDAAAAVTFAGM